MLSLPELNKHRLAAVLDKSSVYYSNLLSCLDRAGIFTVGDLYDISLDGALEKSKCTKDALNGLRKILSVKGYPIKLANITEEEYELIKKDVLKFLNDRINYPYGGYGFCAKGFSKDTFIENYETHILFLKNGKEKLVDRSFNQFLVEQVFDDMLNENCFNIVSNKEDLLEEFIIHRLNTYCYRYDFEPRIIKEYEQEENTLYALDSKYIISNSDQKTFSNESLEYKIFSKVKPILENLSKESYLEIMGTKIMFDGFSTSLKNKLLDDKFLYNHDLVCMPEGFFNVYFKKKEKQQILMYLDTLKLKPCTRLSKEERKAVLDFVLKRDKKEILIVDFIYNIFQLSLYCVNSKKNIYCTSLLDYCINIVIKSNQILDKYIKYKSQHIIEFDDKINEDIESLIILNKMGGLIYK